MHEVRKSFFGDSVVAYRCPACAAELESPLAEAGMRYPCPTCGAPIETPGTDELAEARRTESEVADAKARERAAETKRLAEQRTREALNNRRRRSKPPELVWYGQMYCNGCGYQWKSRRNTPPARCHSCGSRNLTAVQSERFAGVGPVLVGLLVVVVVVLIMFAFSSPRH